MAFMNRIGVSYWSMAVVSGDTAGKDGFLSLVAITLVEGGYLPSPSPINNRLVKGPNLM